MSRLRLTHFMMPRRKNITLPLFLILFFSVPTHPSYPASEVSDRYLSLQEEELAAKERHAKELSERADALQRQIQEDREQIQRAQEKIYREFQDSVEVERKSLKDQFQAIEERQQRFEAELERAKQQDQIRIREREDQLARMVSETQRLRTEMVEDRKGIDTRLEELKKIQSQNKETATRQKREEAIASGDENLSEVPLENRAIKIGTLEPGEWEGKGPLRNKQVRPEYYVEIGDILAIEVWRVPDMKREVTVRPDGRISMPLLGDMDVVGMSLVEIKEGMTVKLSEFIRNPEISISVRQFGGRKFIILGEIRTPGVYRYQQDVNLIEAIALAGGFSREAKKAKVMVIRGDIRKDPQVKIITANMENLIRRGMLSENLTILSNDIIFVTRDFLGDYNDMLKDVIEPTIGAAVDFFVLRSAIRTAQDRRN